MKDVVYSQYHLLDSLIASVAARIELGPKRILVPVRIQLHQSISAGRLPWLYVISNDGNGLIDSVYIHNDASVENDVEDFVAFRIFAVDERRSWESRSFLVSLFLSLFVLSEDGPY